MTEQTQLTNDLPQINPMGKKTPSLNLLIFIFTVSMLFSGALIFLILSRVMTTNEPAFDPNVYTAEGGVRIIDPPRTVSDFTLPAQTGEPLSISELQGKVALIFFGYTHCPDVCPLTMLDFRDVHDMFGTEADHVAFVYISVDGERDAPAVMADYFARRDMQSYMIGLSGDEATLNRIAPEYNLYYNLNPPDDNGFYTVDHTASIYLLDTEGRLSRIFAYGTEPAIIAETIRDILASG
ncbi:MAG: SCO family protein [Aggregatilineales bacterium]